MGSPFVKLRGVGAANVAKRATHHQCTTEPAAGAMVLLLQSGLEKAEQALADEPTDRVARLIKRNRMQALAEIAATP